jgi:hypothetical protein
MNWPFSLETSERLLLTPDEMDARTDRQLRDMIKGLIDSVETGTRDGADKIAVIARAQYYIQELARREQDCQTKVMTEHTKTVKDYTVMIGIMTILVTIVSFVSMIVTVWAVVHPH